MRLFEGRLSDEAQPGTGMTATLPEFVRQSLLVCTLAALAGCGGGNSAPSTNSAVPDVGSVEPTGFGEIRVNVTDYFEQPVAGASVNILGATGALEAMSDSEGNATFDQVRSGEARVCVGHPVRGHACGPDDPVNIPAGGNVEVNRQLQPSYGPPLAAVLNTSVDPDGLSADGRTLDITIRVAVTQPPTAGSWFNLSTAWAPSAAACIARDGPELANLGPNCIRAVGGTLIERPVARTISQPAQPATVGILLDQSAPVWVYEENLVELRLFAARIFADEVLPDIGLLLAGFASDDPSGTYLSLLPQKPVTFLPSSNPGLFLSRPEIFEQLDGLAELSGGIAPLYASILSSIDFVADRAAPGTRRMLVVMANGRDDECKTPTRCAVMRSEIVTRAREQDVELVLLTSDGIDSIDFDSSHAEGAISDLAVDATAPLVVVSGTFHEALDLVKQLLGESVPIEDVRIRLTSEEPGAFHPGAVVVGKLAGTNPSNCPWYCYIYALPFAVTIP